MAAARGRAREAGERRRAAHRGARAARSDSVIGQRHRKVDGLQKATGAAIYADDLALPRMLHAKILRCPHAHARIRRSTRRGRWRCPGVLAVITGSGPARCATASSPGRRDEHALAVDKVRYVGDARGRGRGGRRATAEEALRADRRSSTSCCRPSSIRRGGARRSPSARSTRTPKEGNVTKHVELDVRRRRRRARRRPTWSSRATSSTRASPTRRSSRTARSAYSDADGVLTVYSPTQVPHYLHRELAQVLELPPAASASSSPPWAARFGGKSEPVRPRVLRRQAGA